MRDPDYDPETETDYECIQCGVILSAPSHPVDCPECDAPMLNRAMPNE